MIYQTHSNSRTLIGLSIVVALHVGLIALFKSGMAPNIVQLLPGPMQAVFITEAPPQTTPEMAPPKPPVELPVVDELPVTDVKIDLPAETAITATSQEPAITTDATDVGAGPSLASSELQVDSRYPLTPPQYPPSALRNGEQGALTLLIYVLPDGRPGEVRIGRSSGYPLLDASALREAKRSWRFKPKIVNGQAVATWGTFPVRFQITN